MDLNKIGQKAKNITITVGDFIKNEITKIENLPDNLQWFWCDKNKITTDKGKLKTYNSSLDMSVYRGFLHYNLKKSG